MWNEQYPARFMIIDACVLMDFMNGDYDPFQLTSSLIGPMYDATAIFEGNEE